MPVVIPLRSDLPHFDLQVVLGDSVYTLELCWNSRERAWYMNVQTEAGDDIINGVKVVVDFPLARRSRDPRCPAGVLIAVDTSGESRDPRWDEVLQVGDLGDRVQLLYFEPEEAQLQG